MSKIIDKQKEKEKKVIEELDVINEPVYITIDDFIDKHEPLTSAKRKFYIDNNKTEDLRTEEDWRAITGLK